MRKALIIGPGGLRGAYGGGVAATLGRKLGPGYFDTIYGCSAGAYTGSYLASGQPEKIELIWRECVHDKLLVKPAEIFRRKLPVLDLYYLNDVLRSRRYHLSVSNLLASSTQLQMVVTEHKTGMPHYFSPTSEAEFFLQVRASAAVPFIHPKVEIHGASYVDGGLSDPFPVERAVRDGHDEIILISNSPLASTGFIAATFLTAYAGYAGRQGLQEMQRRIGSAILLQQSNNASIRIISPSQKLKHRWQFDSSRERINQLVDLGICDALAFL